MPDCLDVWKHIGPGGATILVPFNGCIRSWLISTIQMCHPCAAAGPRMIEEIGDRPAIRSKGYGVGVMVKKKPDKAAAA